MTIATLLLRDASTASLSSIVERAQTRKPPFLEYDLKLDKQQLEFVLTSNGERAVKSTSSDEGFESDIDSLSIVSSDDSFTSAKTNENDSANGSESDSDSGTVTKRVRETNDLVNCLCYTDVKFPDILVFVIRDVTYVFKFGDLGSLHNFYGNFTTLKAVCNQRAYNKDSPAKFNLLQRTDNNGVTHIEITGVCTKDDGPSSIISINTPRQRTEPTALVTKDNSLRKVWNSAEDLLNGPSRPERRKKIKGKAPAPPIDNFSGQFVRVNVNFAGNEPHPKKLQSFKLLTPVVVKPEVSTLTRIPHSTWTNSVPRMLKKPRSKSESRQFTPMAYRYIDTTQSYTLGRQPHYPQMKDRLFGLSSKLRDFSGQDSNSQEEKWTSGNLKSVIKKEDTKKKEKKVTFSAYTTVQVV